MGISGQRLLLLCLAAALSGCDSWPTTIDNRSLASIRVQYHHKDYKDWSVEFDPLQPGHAILLARGHFAKEIVGLKIREGDTLFELDADSLTRLHQRCPASGLFAGNCYLSYLGSGQFSFDTKPPESLDYGR